MDCFLFRTQWIQFIEYDTANNKKKSVERKNKWDVLHSLWLQPSPIPPLATSTWGQRLWWKKLRLYKLCKYSTSKHDGVRQLFSVKSACSAIVLNDALVDHICHIQSRNYLMSRSSIRKSQFQRLALKIPKLTILFLFHWCL